MFVEILQVGSNWT